MVSVIYCSIDFILAEKASAKMDCVYIADVSSVS